MPPLPAGTKPFVSILVPTYNRRRFIPQLLRGYASQTYPKERMELIVLDDGTDCVEDMFKGIPGVRYVRAESKMKIGAKRNMLNKLARGDIMVCMDDDDYYPPERVEHAVSALATSKANLAGSSEIYMYYTDSCEIWKFGPYGPKHATNGTFAYKRAYAQTHLYDETVDYAEERSFLEDYKHPMVQLNPMKVMLVIAHEANTYGKHALREKARARRAELIAKEDNGIKLTPQEENEKHLVTLTGMKLKNFIRDAATRDFYKVEH